MGSLTLRAATAAFALLAVSASAGAQTVTGVVLSPVAVTGSTLGTTAGTTANLFNQSGLSAGFTSGVTDFATYIAGAPSHGSCTSSTCWASNAGQGYLQFDLGASFGISALALWLDGSSLGNTNNIQSFSLISAADELFTSNVSSLGSFSAVQFGAAQVFNLSGTGRYVRLNVLSNFGGSSNVIGEVAFNVSSTPVPEPTSLGLVMCGLAAAVFSLRHRARLAGRR